MAAYSRCLRCAGAPGDPRVVPSFRCSFLPDMPPSPTRKSDIDIFQNFDADIGLRRMTTGSALPTLPQSVPRGRSISWLHWFASATAARLLAPCTDQTGILPQPPGTFTSRLSTDRSSSPLLDITTTATGLLCWRISPAGMAASFASGSFSTDAAGFAARPTSVSPRKLTSGPCKKFGRDGPTHLNTEIDQLGLAMALSVDPIGRVNWNSAPFLPSDDAVS